MKPEKLTEEKIYKRRRKNKRYITKTIIKLQKFQIEREKEIFKSVVKEVMKKLITVGFNDFKYPYADITIPSKFTLVENYETTLKVIIDYIGAIINHLGGVIEIDFSKCKVVDTSAIFLMQVLRFEIDEDFRKRTKLIQSIETITTYKIIPSKHKNVNRMLLLSGLIDKQEYDNCVISSNEDNSDQFEPMYRTGYYKGSKAQKHYLENRKGDITTAIVVYINNCLKVHDSSLKAIDQSSLEGILSEILNNAEDHGVFNYWYVTANFSIEGMKEGHKEDLVGQLNLSILNFGESIYEGLIKNKLVNYAHFSELITAKDNLESNFPNHKFTDSDLFTLYALQEGTSRLKYLDESRGTGTIKFINSFLKLGDYKDPNKNYIPNLSILSGNTLIKCDNDYKPFDNNGVFILTLNQEKDLRLPPNRSHLTSLDTKFPGTLLNVSLYLTREHLKSKEIK